MSLKVLFIDDNPQRHHTFKRNLGFAKSPYGFIEAKQVWTYDAAVAALTETVYDVVFFDYDLNDHPDLNTSYVAGVYGNTKLTGEDIALAMLQLPKERWPKRCVIHSWNVGGANILERLLEGAGILTVRREFHAKTGKDL